ncbi:MAG TPA: carboxypeptidase-like regulatory domain-containing protein [Bacteroidales bacterium]|nr:carboxypeptidase-like regulatory domain-containing protein [Bacteroidales bacterium]
MISCLKYGSLILFFLSAQTIRAQNISENDPVLYNGKIYTFHLHPETRGHQYLDNQQFSKGWLKIRDLLYDGLNINYDVFNQQVILKYLNSGNVSRQIIISDAWLKAFGYGGMNFELAGPDRKIFQTLGNRPCRIFIHWTKSLDLSREYGARNYVFSKPKKEMFLALNDTLLPFSGNKGFISAFRSVAGDSSGDLLRTYLKKNRLNIRKTDKNTIEELLAYCTGFLKPSGKIREVGAGTRPRIFYKPGSPDTLDVDMFSDTISLLTQLNMKLEGTGLVAWPWNNDIVIIPAGTEILDLPDYSIPVSVSDSLNAPEKKMTETEAKYLSGRGTVVTQVIKVGTTGATSAGLRARILGRILDVETGEPLAGVPVYIRETKTGAATDVNGFVNLTLAPGSYNAEVAYLGYAARKFILQVLSDGSFTLTLQKAEIRLQNVVVIASAQSGMNMKDAGLDQISVRNLKSLPVLMGEQDVLKVSVTLPGIVSVGEGSAGLNVRGGGYDQNSFYINRIPVYNTSHLFGFFSSFNSDIVRDVSIYKGYIPVQYGGRLASVFDITARQGNRKHFTAHGGISPVTGNLTVEGPFRKDAGSFIISGRSSYSDWILSRLRDTTIRSSRAKFNDISGGLSLDAGKSRFSLFFYSSYDKFRLAEITDYDYSNNGASAIFSHTYNNALRSEVFVSGSVYGFNTSDMPEPSSAYTHSYRLRNYGSGIIFKHVLNENNKLEYGMDVSLYDLDRGTVRPYNERSLRIPLSMGRENGMEASLFITDYLRISQLIGVDLGIRYGVFVPAGPSEVYIYRNGVPVDPKYITDTLHFRRNEPVKRYSEPDVRASVNIRTGEFSSVKAAFNQMHQNIFMLNAGITLAPNTQWKLADYYLKPSESNLFSLGFYRTFPTAAMEASAELYYKRAENYPEFREGADFLKNSHVEALVLQGSQKAYGFEAYVKRSSRKLEGWISYAFSRSVMTVKGLNSWDRINKGEPYPSNYDIPHSVNAILSYHFTRRIIFSSSYTYQTGKPVTYPESVYYIDGSQYVDYSGRNAYRIPDYMRVDLSLTIEGNLKAGKPVHSSYIFNLYNATGRMNPHSVYFRSEDGRIRSYMYSVIGVPIFTATWQFKLGNYASE